MKLALIGMSGVGKTYWAKQLEQSGFTRFCCDELIEQHLQKIIKNSGTSGLSEWMGQPYDTQYNKTSKIYLHLETLVVKHLVSQLKHISGKENVVIDTTGSIIYLEEKILEDLRKETTVMYFRASEETMEELFERYCNDPKPVIWGNIYNKKNGETNRETLLRCFPKLLQWRSRQYEQLAHATIDYYTLKNLKNAQGLIDAFHYA